MWYWSLVFALLLPAWLTPAEALTPNNVLVVYYQPGDAVRNTDGFEIWQHYRTLRPVVPTRSDHDLNLAEYYPSGVSLAPGTISYADFVTLIRTPIREHLRTKGLAQTVRVIVLTKGIPHRINDLNRSGLGDQGAAAVTATTAGRATFASVDSELTLLWYDLEAGENGDAMDSPADSMVVNPFYKSAAAFETFAAPPTPWFPAPALSFQASIERDGVIWKLMNGVVPIDAGRMYLTSRLDGHTLEDVKVMIDSAQTTIYDLHQDQLIFDRPAVGSASGADRGEYESTVKELSQFWAKVTYDSTQQLLLGNSAGTYIPTALEPISRVDGRVAYIASYGANHKVGVSQGGWLSTYSGQLIPGAIMNTYESFNGRDLGGVGGFGDHAQVAEWIAMGGTFALGHVWEPLIQGVAHDGEVIENFFANGWTWAESAWSSIAFLSWQNVVMGDPLATASVNTNPLVRLKVSVQPGLELDRAVHPARVTIDRPLPADMQIPLRFVGATEGEGKDYSLNLGNGTMSLVEVRPNETDVNALLYGNQTETNFQVRVLDDAVVEGLEILGVSLLPSEDLDGDGFGDIYSFWNRSQLIPIADGGFDWWWFQHVGSGNPLTAVFSDFDHDGLDSVWEYLLGRRPVVAEGPYTDSMTEVLGEVGPSGFTFVVPASFQRGLTLAVETTANPSVGDWMVAYEKRRSYAWTQGPGGAGFSIESVRDEVTSKDKVTISFPETDRRFFQLRLSVQSEEP